MSHGQFSDDPKTTWVTEPEDRDMTLIEDFRFVDPDNETWDAPATKSINGASIPRALWTVIGSPYTGPYRRGSIVHDIACSAAGKDHAKRLAADKMFYHACRAGGCTIFEATILYVGVRFGAWMSGAGLVDDSRVRTQRTFVERQMEEDFRAACDLVLREDSSDDIDIIERRTQGAMQQVASARLRLLDLTAALAVAE